MPQHAGNSLVDHHVEIMKEIESERSGVKVVGEDAASSSQRLEPHEKKELYRRPKGENAAEANKKKSEIVAEDKAFKDAIYSFSDNLERCALLL